MVRRRIAIVALLLSLGGAAVVRADPTDDYVRARLKDFDLPGLSLAVVKDGVTVKAEGYGLADKDRNVPAAPDTVYKIGSVSKQFVATGIMLLVQDERVGVDDPISRYLEKTPASWAHITIRHLLTHTSGLVRESPAFSPMKNMSDAELLRAVHPMPLRFAPGEKWEYSNSGFVALAEIIRIVTGQPWTAYLQQKIFGPAGMNVTLPTNTTAAVPNRAVGFGGRNNERKVQEWVALRASGAFLSTVLDLAKWDAVLYSDKILAEASKREMWKAVRLNGASTAAYGLGWHVDSSREGGRRVWHGGGLPGFTSHFVRYVDARLSVIVLSNGDDSDMGAIANGVAALFLR